MDNIEKENQELSHYGIPGMKWGVRRAQVRSDNLRQKVANLSNTEIKTKAHKILEKKVKSEKAAGRLIMGALTAAILTANMPVVMAGATPLVATMGIASGVGAASKLLSSKRKNEMLMTLDDVLMSRQTKNTIDELKSKRK